MALDLKLTKEFFGGVTSAEYQERRIVFTESFPELGKPVSDFIYSSENGVLEIVITKELVLRIFRECHPLLKEYLNNRIGFVNDDKLLVKLYYVTIGMLLTTHENNTVINIHEQIVLEILRRLAGTQHVFVDPLIDPSRFIFKELRFLQAILNSNSNKLNKSSSLWTFFKRMFIYSIDHSSEIISKLPPLFFVKTALKAAELHPSNYYAWNFIRFTSSISKLQIECSYYVEVLDIIHEYCKRHVNDASAWMCYVDSIQLNTSSLNLVLFEFNKYTEHVKLSMNPKRLMISFPSSNQRLMNLSKWLWDTKVVSEVPYHAFQQLSFYSIIVWNEKDLIREMFSQIKIHCSLLEELKLKPCKIELEMRNGYFTTNIDTTQDYELDQMLKNYFNWKKLLNWYDRFLKDKYISHTP